MNLDLPAIFVVLMGVAMFLYVVLDGYDLGVGMLLPAGDAREQNFMVSAIGPFWDANETWLVLGIGLLLVAFPVAHGVILTSLYLYVALMLIGLLLRGVAFEFRVKALGWHRELWNGLFWFGSFVAALAQGLMLGSYVTGFEPGFGTFLFSLVVAGGLCGGYVLLGATWLIYKTEGPLQRKACAWTRWGLLWVAVGIALVSIGTPLASESVRAKWFDFPRTLAVMALPLATAVAWAWVWRAAGRLAEGGRGPEWGPFAGAVVIFSLAFAGLAYSLLPYLVLDRITFRDAAAHPSSLKVLLIGAVAVLPFIVGYTIFSYRVFRGKAPEKLYE